MSQLSLDAVKEQIQSLMFLDPAFAYGLTEQIIDHLSDAQLNDRKIHDVCYALHSLAINISFEHMKYDDIVRFLNFAIEGSEFGLDRIEFHSNF